jgi:hypothetical protein
MLFSGDISSRGKIAAVSAVGIAVDLVSSFVGGINNSGTIAAKTAIVINSSTIIGAIINAGSVAATSLHATADDHGGTLVSSTPHIEHQSLFTRPQA